MGVRLTHPFRGVDQARELGLRVVRRDPPTFVAKQVLSILERHAGSAQAPAERVLQIVDSHFPESRRRRFTMLLGPLVRRSLSRCLPRGVVDFRHRLGLALLGLANEHVDRVHPTYALDH